MAEEAWDGHHVWGQKRHLQKRIRSSSQREEEENQRNTQKGRWRYNEKAGVQQLPRWPRVKEKRIKARSKKVHWG